MAEPVVCTACGSTDVGWETVTDEPPPRDDAWMEESGLTLTETCECWRVCHACGHRWQENQTGVRS